MKKINMKYVAVGSILGLGGFLLYRQYHEMKLVEKNTEDYILNGFSDEEKLKEFPNRERQKRKYITLRKAKGNR